MTMPKVDAIYDLVVRGFTELGASNPKCIGRSFLLKDMNYAGQVWRCEDWKAVWWLGAETIQFFDAAGNPVTTLTLVPDVARKAA